MVKVAFKYGKIDKAMNNWILIYKLNLIKFFNYKKSIKKTKINQIFNINIKNKFNKIF